MFSVICSPPISRSEDGSAGGGLGEECRAVRALKPRHTARILGGRNRAEISLSFLDFFQGGAQNKNCKGKFLRGFRRSDSGGGWRGESVRFSSEPSRAPRVISRGSVQKKLEFQPKGTANLQFQSFRKFYASAVQSPRLRAGRKGLILQRFATLRVAKKKCFGFGFGSSFWRSQSKTKFCNQSFFVSPKAKLGSDNF